METLLITGLNNTALVNLDNGFREFALINFPETNTAFMRRASEESLTPKQSCVLGQRCEKSKVGSGQRTFLQHFRCQNWSKICIFALF